MPAKAEEEAPPSRVDFVVNAIREGIRVGEYVPGQRLVESDLTQAFGISRGPLREAMRRLAGDGLVVIEPHKGVAVRKMSAEDLEELYDVRRAMESLAARLAAKHIDEGDNRARLKALVDAMRAHKKGSDVMAYTALNEEFHQLIVEMSGNRYLHNLVNQLRVPIFRYQFNRFLDNDAKKNSIDEHQAIAKAILERDGNKAEKAMRHHVNHSSQLTQAIARQGQQ